MLSSLLHVRSDRQARKAWSREAYERGLAEGPSPDAGPIERAYFAHRGRVVHKLHHYLPLYDRYFAPYRGRPLRFLEIGVSQGGSLELWRGYFGSEATIFGIDIDPGCAKLDGESASVRIGSQVDPAFLNSVVAEMGGVDIVLDDGSHMAPHVRQSLEILFPLLADGGLYMIEDLHCAYWPKWGGGYERRSNFFSTVRTIIDDMHHWYHGRGVRLPFMQDQVGGIHVHDALVAIEKRDVRYPTASRQPRR